MLETDEPHIAKVLDIRQDHTIKQLRDAARTGKLSALMWLRAVCQQTYWIQRANLMEDAASAGHIHILQHLLSKADPVRWDKVLAKAAEHLDCSKWLLSIEAPGGAWPSPDHILANIAHHHGLPALKWFRSNGKLPQDVWSPLLFGKAAEMGDQPIVEWLRIQDPPCPWDEGVAAAAATKNVETLQWLRSQDPPCPWGPGTCAAAAGAGNMKTLIWLRAQDPPCPWTEACFVAAAHQANVETLEWLESNGCPFVSTAFRKCDIVEAAFEGHLTVLEWLYEHGCALTDDMYITAAWTNRAGVLKFLHEKKGSSS